MSVSFFVLVPFAMAVLFLSLWRPGFAVLLPLVFHQSYFVRSSLFGIPVTGLEVLIITVLLGFWLPKLSQFSLKEIKNINLQVVFVVLFFVSATISAFIAPHQHTAWGIWKAMIVEPILYMATIYWAKKTHVIKTDSLVVALVSGGLVSVVLSAVAWQFGPNFGRFRGIYDVPNSLALVLSPLFVIAVVKGIFSKNKKLYLFIAAILGLFLVATQSLAGITSAILVLGLWFILSKNKKALILLALFCAVCLFLLFFSGRLKYLANSSSSLIARKQIWVVASELVKNNLVLGTGLGTFEPAYQEQMHKLLASCKSVSVNRYFCKQAPLEWVVRDPHNIFFSFWLNAGLLGVVSILGLVFLKVKKMFFIIKNNHPEVVLSLAFLTILFFGLFDVPYWKNDLALLWWIYWL